MLTHRVMFLRDKYTFDKNNKMCAGNPIGCVAIKLRGNVAEYQLSVLNPVDRFDRGVARQLALGRLVESAFVVRLPRNANMHDITEAVMNDIVKYAVVPARARKAAKLWLRWNTAQ